MICKLGVCTTDFDFGWAFHQWCCLSSAVRTWNTSLSLSDSLIHLSLCFRFFCFLFNFFLLFVGCNWYFRMEEWFCAFFFLLLQWYAQLRTLNHAAECRRVSRLVTSVRNGENQNFVVGFVLFALESLKVRCKRCREKIWSAHVSLMGFLGAVMFKHLHSFRRRESWAVNFCIHSNGMDDNLDIKKILLLSTWNLLGLKIFFIRHGASHPSWCHQNP